MLRRLPTLCCLVFAIAGVALADGPVQAFRIWAEAISRRMADLRFQRGDDPSWAAKDLDVSSWQPISTYGLPSRDGIYWVRWRVTQHEGETTELPDGIMLRVVASYDLYWDGRLIGRNGTVGTSAAEEVPGNIDGMFQIPAELLGPGEHVVALRMSSFHTGFPRGRYMVIFHWGNFRSMLIERVRSAIFSVTAVGAGVVTAMVFGLMWLLAARRTALLVFTLLALSVAAMQAMQAWRWLYDYPYSWHYPRLVAIAWLFTAIAVLLPVFVMHQFRVGSRRIVYPLLVGIVAWAWLTGASNSYGFISMRLCSAGLVVALVLTVRAASLRRRGAVFASAGLALSFTEAIRLGNEFLDHAFFLSAGPAAIGLLIALVLQLRDEARAARQTQLTAARLEIELLKKNIQPHFVLNTLATIVEIIEQEPKTAVALIEALASEFRILNRVSGEKLIALGQELELCRAHLHVMSLRKGARGEFRVNGVDERALVPPALFLTLVENGLTHLLPRDGRLEFTLTEESRAVGVRYRLRAEGVRQGSNAEAAAAWEGTAVEGTGLRYIKARLEESFTGRWTVASQPVMEGWETVIEINGAPAAAPGSANAVVLPGLPTTEKPA